MHGHLAFFILLSNPERKVYGGKEGILCAKNCKKGERSVPCFKIRLVHLSRLFFISAHLKTSVQLHKMLQTHQHKRTSHLLTCLMMAVAGQDFLKQQRK